jgi:hypothetical protein
MTGLKEILSKTMGDCECFSNDSTIRTIVGNEGGQKTVENVLYRADGVVVCNAMNLKMSVQSIPVVELDRQRNPIKSVYYTTGVLFAIVIFTKSKEVAGKLSPYTYEETQDEIQARIYDGAGFVVWTRHITVDGIDTRKDFDLIVKNVSDFNVVLEKGSRISLLSSSYTDLEKPNQSLSRPSVILVGDLHFNLIGKKDEVTMM